MILAEAATTDWRRIGQQAIREETPVGEPVRDDPSFEDLQAEIKKLDAVSRPLVNWSEVVNIGRQILVEKSKDLLVATYLCYGLFERDGYSGLRGGLACLEGLISSHWDSMYPEASRIKARKNAIEWLIEKLEKAVSAKPPRSSSDEGASKSCLESITVIEGVLHQKLGAKNVPGFESVAVLLEEAPAQTSVPSNKGGSRPTRHSSSNSMVSRGAAE